MKILFFALAFTSFGAFAAANCSPKAEVNIARIAKKATCLEAKALAEDCAWGSSIDVQIAGTAAEVCLAKAGTMSDEDGKLMNAMSDRCDKAFGSLEGSMYRSANAFCRLNAVSFITSLMNPEGE